MTTSPQPAATAADVTKREQVGSEGISDPFTQMEPVFVGSRFSWNSLTDLENNPHSTRYANPGRDPSRGQTRHGRSVPRRRNF